MEAAVADLELDRPFLPRQLSRQRLILVLPFLLGNDPGPVRSSQHPQTAVLHAGAVHRHPAGDHVGRIDVKPERLVRWQGCLEPTLAGFMNNWS